jgi:hypothetical protein
MDYGMGFSLDANRQRCLRALGWSFFSLAIAGLCLWSASSSTDAFRKMEGILLTVIVGGVALFWGVLAWVRGRDWSYYRQIGVRNALNGSAQ